MKRKAQTRGRRGLQKCVDPEFADLVDGLPDVFALEGIPDASFNAAEFESTLDQIERDGVPLGLLDLFINYSGDANPRDANLNSRIDLRDALICGKACESQVLRVTVDALQLDDRPMLDKSRMQADTVTNHAQFHFATVICQHFPPGKERAAWLDWLTRAAAGGIGKRIDNCSAPSGGDSNYIADCGIAVGCRGRRLRGVRRVSTVQS